MVYDRYCYKCHKHWIYSSPINFKTTSINKHIKIVSSLDFLSKDNIDTGDIYYVYDTQHMYASIDKQLMRIQ